MRTRWMRQAGSIIAVCSVLAFAVSAKAAEDSPRFQVATIRPSTPNEPTLVVLIKGNRLTATAGTVVDLMKYAYGIHPSQVVGGPDWLRSAKFDIVADPETEARPSSDTFKAMVQALLVERFHLTMHTEQRELPVFVLVAAKSGPKLTATKDKPEGLPWVAHGPGGLTAHNASTADMAKFLQRFVTDKPVIDNTGIAGRYDMDLEWMPDDLPEGMKAALGDAAATLPSLYTAIQEQLGLKLEAKKEQVPVMVIDRLEIPGEN